MRLIDADELLILETVAYNKAQAKTDDKITRLVNEVVHKKIQMLVSDAPTAYDVDKVVEELEEYSNADEAERHGTIPVIELDDAIDIVKRGGVDDDWWIYKKWNY